jgi:hypothetical protein
VKTAMRSAPTITSSGFAIFGRTWQENAKYEIQNAAFAVTNMLTAISVIYADRDISHSDIV